MTARHRLPLDDREIHSPRRPMTPGLRAVEAVAQTAHVRLGPAETSVRVPEEAAAEMREIEEAERALSDRKALLRKAISERGMRVVSAVSR